MIDRHQTANAVRFLTDEIPVDAAHIAHYRRCVPTHFSHMQRMGVLLGEAPGSGRTREFTFEEAKHVLLILYIQSCLKLEIRSAARIAREWTECDDPLSEHQPFHLFEGQRTYLCAWSKGGETVASVLPEDEMQQKVVDITSDGSTILCVIELNRFDDLANRCLQKAVK